MSFAKPYAVVGDLRQRDRGATLTQSLRMPTLQFADRSGGSLTQRASSADRYRQKDVSICSHQGPELSSSPAPGIPLTARGLRKSATGKGAVDRQSSCEPITSREPKSRATPRVLSRPAARRSQSSDRDADADTGRSREASSGRIVSAEVHHASGTEDNQTVVGSRICCDHCGRMVPRSALQNHRVICAATLSQCELIDTVTGERCTAGYFSRRALSVHSGECPHRVTPCDDCGKLVSVGSMHLHRGPCQAEVVQCAHCSASLTRSEKVSHEQNSCPGVTIVCPLGCKERMLRRDVLHHIDFDWATHDPQWLDNANDCYDHSGSDGTRIIQLLLTKLQRYVSAAYLVHRESARFVSTNEWVEQARPRAASVSSTATSEAVEFMSVHNFAVTARPHSQQEAPVGDTHDRTKVGAVAVSPSESVSFCESPQHAPSAPISVQEMPLS